MGLFSMLTGADKFNKAVQIAKEDPDTILIDVRTPAEYKGGHVPGAINIPVEKIDTIDVDETKKLLVYCMSGARSERARMWLYRNGYNAENIGGIAGYNGVMEY